MPAQNAEKRHDTKHSGKGRDEEKSPARRPETKNSQGRQEDRIYKVYLTTGEILGSTTSQACMVAKHP